MSYWLHSESNGIFQQVGFRYVCHIIPFPFNQFLVLTHYSLITYKVYVGLYGFSFVEAGGNVMKLFRERGWTSIITDNMTDTVLFMVSLGIAILVGILAIFTSAIQGGSDGGTVGVSFVIGFIVGFGMCTTLFSVVSSAVNTVIVCYAEAPNEFQANHPELSNSMRAAWRQTWPSEFNY